MHTSKNTYGNTSSGVLLINTGTPEQLSKQAVKRFIGDMLSDPYVLGMTKWVRIILARKIIAPLRASESFKKYSLIWGKSEQLSPLLFNTLQLADTLEQKILLPVSVAMRYGNPSVDEAIKDLENRCPKLREVILLPLFPQYAASSYQTAVKIVKKHPFFSSGKYTLKIIDAYYNAPSYITAWSEKISSELNGEGSCHLVFSYHSLPLKHIEAGKRQGISFDYEYQCRETSKLIAKQLGITDYSVVYASAIGRNWQGPILDNYMLELPAKGIKKIAVIAPGFIIDNLESLYDIAINARNLFKQNGGESFVFIPCLNTEFASAAATLVKLKVSISL